VHEELQATRPGGYTTILKLMQIMTKKGLVRRDESARTHFYEAEPSKDQTQKDLLHDLVNRAFEGSAQQLVMQALSTEPSTKAELQEIRKLLDDLEGRAQ
jgi:predicted transcriptional regulator